MTAMVQTTVVTMEEPALDIDAAVHFLRQIFEGETVGNIVLAFGRVRADGQKVFARRGVSLQSGNWDDMARKFIAQYAETHDCYFSVARFGSDARGKVSGTAATMISSRWVFCDQDHRRIGVDVPAPTFIIETSAGRYQRYYQLDKQVPDTAILKEINVRIANACGDLSNDAVDAVHLLRLPGTRNHKPTHNREIVAIIEDTERSYPLTAFDCLPLAKPKAKEPPIAPTPSTGERADWHRILDKALGRLQKNGRNTTGFWLACQMRDNNYAEGETMEILEREYLPRTPPTDLDAVITEYTPEELKASIHQAYSHAEREPWSQPKSASHTRRGPIPIREDLGSGDHTHHDGPPTGNGAGDEVAERQAPYRALTDLGNAERLIDRFGENLRYSAALGWLVWNGTSWIPDEIGRVHMFAKRTVRDMLREAGDSEDYEQRKALAKWAIRSESAAALASIVQVARTEPDVPVLTAALDASPWLFTVANGTLDLWTGEVGPHRREDLITKASPVAYDPNATCPRWLEFLHRIMEGDETRVSYLQRAIGYSLTGDTSERAMFVLYGKGKNGKSTMLSVISELVGDFATRTPTETLMQKQNEGIPNDIAKLRGARFVFASEAEDGKRLAESLIKDLTGEDRIAARFMRQEWFEFVPTFKIWFSTNHRPVIRGTDEAIWDRLKLVPFNYRFPDGEQRPKHEVLAEFRAELPGILAWAVRGCRDWRKKGLGTSEAIRAATAEYRTDMDTLGMWIAEECVESPIATCSSTALYDDYKRWTENNGERPATHKAFAAQLAERGYPKTRLRKGISYAGIRLKDRSEKDDGAF